MSCVGGSQAPHNAPARRAPRLGQHLPEKVAVWLGLAVGICVPYFGLQYLDALPSRSVPILALDRVIPFEPDWIYAYVSLALLVPLAPLMARDRDPLARYARGLAALCLPSFVLFALAPVLGPRPDALPTEGLYAWIVGVDRPTNSMPSLHAGLTLYSLLFLDRVLRGEIPALTLSRCRFFGGLWGLAILYSTLATKQHWVVDLPAGMLLAWAAHAWAWRGAVKPPGRADPEAPR